MDTYTRIVTSNVFSTLSLQVTKYPKTLFHWEKLINHLISQASPINKSLDPRIHELISSSYSSMLFNFPFLENYYIDYALFEYKLGNISTMHKIFRRGLQAFDQKSLLLWVSYLKICNEIVIDNKQLFKKYESAEHHVGLHYFAGEFWQLYLEQVKERCKTKNRYFIILRKVLEIPLYSFSKFYALWLHEVEEIKDLSELAYIASKEDLKKKLKIDTCYKGRRGPYLLEAKKSIRKFTKELYLVTQYQTLELYNLYESKITTHYYISTEALITSKEIRTWEQYLDYVINMDNETSTYILFHRAMIPLAHYELVWIKFATWLIDRKENYLDAKNILVKGLRFSLKKANILKLLYSTLVKLGDYDNLESLLSEIEESFSSNIEESEDFELFWDYIQYYIFLKNSVKQSRYTSVELQPLLPALALEKIKKRLDYAEKKKGQEEVISSMIQLQTKDNTKIIEEEIFKHLIDQQIPFYLENGKFWSLYCYLIYFDPARSYLEKRTYIINSVWNLIKPNQNIYESLLAFCESYLPEDVEQLIELFDI